MPAGGTPRLCLESPAPPALPPAGVEAVSGPGGARADDHTEEDEGKGGDEGEEDEGEGGAEGGNDEEEEGSDLPT